MVNKDECLMEAIQPQAVWIIPMGYEVDEATLEAYSQHLLNSLEDTKEERFRTYKEKSMELHSKFTKPTRKRKVENIVEDILVEEGHPREKVKATRAKKDAVEKEKKQNPASAPVKIKVTRPSHALVKTPTTKFEPSDVSAKGKSVLRKKHKTHREYIVVSPVESKIESNSKIYKAPKKGKFSRVI